jgi:hypothetical protein
MTNQLHEKGGREIEVGKCSEGIGRCLAEALSRNLPLKMQPAAALIEVRT